MQMHHCHNSDMVIINLIENSVRKLVCQTTSCFCINTCPGIWMLTYSFNSCKNFFRKSQTQTRLAFFVIVNNNKKFFFSSFMKTKFHFKNRFRTFSKTSSPEISFASPRSSSSERRSTSNAHA